MRRTTVITSTLAVIAVLTFVNVGTLLPSGTTALEAETRAKAVSIAEGLLREIASMEFDEARAQGLKIYSASDLTPSSRLGADPATSVGQHGRVESGITGTDSSYYLNGANSSPSNNGGTFIDFQSKSLYDDVDDFDGYRRRVWDERHGSFDAEVAVRFVREEKPDIVSTIPTFQKCISVTVSHSRLTGDENAFPPKIVLKDIVAYRRFSQLPLQKE